MRSSRSFLILRLDRIGEVDFIVTSSSRNIIALLLERKARLTSEQLVRLLVYWLGCELEAMASRTAWMSSCGRRPFAVTGALIHGWKMADTCVSTC